MIPWIAVAAAQDLVVDGTDVVLSGSWQYDRVIVRNGGRLLVAGVDEAPDGGALGLTAAAVRVEAGSAIVGVGAGHPGVADGGGLGPAGGGAGLAAGAGGSSGGPGTPGWAEGCVPDGLTASGPGDDGPGSAGGGANGRPGGNGGAALEIVADTIEIFGTIDLSGADGAGGAGGGAGGWLSLRGDTVRCSGALLARGGSGGGGGGGGTVVLASDAEAPACPVDVTGGASSCACGGGDGVVLRSTADHDGDGVLFQDGDCRSSDPAVHPGAAESTCNGADDDCDGAFDEDAASCGGCDRIEDGPGTSWLFCSTPATRDEADAACATEGAYTLATLGDDAENELVFAEALLRSPPDTDWFLGFEDRAVEGQWGWSSGLPITFADWAVTGSPQPNDYHGDPYVGADCASIGYYGSRWRDLHCDSPNPFVCEVCPERTWYADADGDGWGDALDGLPSCAPLPGRAERSGDCADGDAAVHPSAFETCDGVDDDCDGVLDDADGPVAWFPDADADGSGDPAGLVRSACASPPAGTVARAGDCDDGNGDVGPGEPELCDGLDQDCDGAIDEDDACVGCTRETSADGRSTWLLCADPIRWADVSQECVSRGYAFVTVDDGGENERLANLGRAEGEDPWIGLSDLADEAEWVWDDGSPAAYTHWAPGQPDDGGAGMNQDCARFWPSEAYSWDDSVCTGTRSYLCEAQCPLVERYGDFDGDGYGGGPPVQACDGTPGLVANALDCDDEQPTVHPAAPEVPADGTDQDCDGADRCWVDGDGDGYGGAPTSGSCASAGLAARGGDCDDGDPAAYPGAPEIAGDGVDQDCDCGDVCFADGDGDGVGLEPVPVGDTSCGDGLVAVGGDCDDADPDNSEICDDPPVTVPTDDGPPAGKGAGLSSEEGLSGYVTCGCRTAGGAGLFPTLLALLGARAARRRSRQFP